MSACSSAGISSGYSFSPGASCASSKGGAVGRINDRSTHGLGNALGAALGAAGLGAGSNGGRNWNLGSVAACRAIVGGVGAGGSAHFNVGDRRLVALLHQGKSTS